MDENRNKPRLRKKSNIKTDCKWAVILAKHCYPSGPMKGQRMPAWTFKARCLEHNHPLQADPFEYIQHMHIHPLNKMPKKLEASTSNTGIVDAEDLSLNVARPTETSTASTEIGDAEYNISAEGERRLLPSLSTTRLWTTEHPCTVPKL
ncbi:Protein of unknown function [Pyronema omphalodes CBS 100304]|uniref:Uncharacterized protein n=1 Tax=Pyronema omphalodes (strain CBS 100304) TaxID=1076935 RepID=U4LAY1_PYROM|nr:Protein of unknown function [Pyronema omphalodes CBS 100304]